MSGPGEGLGGLELLWRLGAGGQGEVWLARPWQQVSVRRAATGLLLRMRLGWGPLGVACASRLGLAAVKLAHPAMADSLHDEHACLAAPGGGHRHLVSLYGLRYPEAAVASLGFAHLEPATALPYLVTAYEPGRTLDRLLGQWGSWRPPATWSLAVAAQVAQALDCLHRRGIVHHDLRPANLVLRPGPEAVLIDLGAAQPIGTRARRAVYGVEAWLPPERRGPAPAPATALVDIYGLGALLRVLTAGVELSPTARSLIAAALAPDPSCRPALSSFEALGRLEA